MAPKPALLPIHDFHPEDDLGHRRVRHVALELRNDYNFSEPHRHAYYEVFFFTRGGGSHLIDFVSHEVADGSVHIVSPGQVHLLRRAPASFGAVVHFSRDAVADAAARLLQGAPAVSSHAPEPFARIRQLLGLLAEEEAGPAGATDAQLACLQLLLLKSLPDEPAAGPDGRGRRAERFAAFQSLLESHYREGRPPAWYAAQLHMTEKALNTLCKESCGQPVRQCLIERAMLEARRLLSHGEGSIKEIGYHLGFEDPAYFNRFFRKHAGITAGEFRKKFR